MTPDGELSPAKWYEAAELWHRDFHQACPCCHGRHCVFRSQWGERVEYHCNDCDFSASRDWRTGRCFTTAEQGREQPSAVLDGLSLSAADSF